MSPPPAELARRFQDEVEPRFARHFFEFVGEHFEVPEGRIAVLDAACGIGSLTLELAPKILPHGTLTAISSDRFALKVFHERLGESPPEGLFIRKDDPSRLPFDDEVFDGALLCQPSRPDLVNRRALSESLRCLRKGKRLWVCVPLHGSLLELAATLTASDNPETRRLLTGASPLHEPEKWQDALLQAGASSVRVEKKTFALPLERPIDKDPLLWVHLARLWLGEAPRPNDGNTIDEMLPLDLTVRVHAGLFVAEK